MRRPAKRIAFFLPFLLIMTACATTGIDFGRINLISTEQEIQLGRNLAVEIEQQQPVLQNPALTQYVSEIGHAVAAQSDRPVKFATICSRS